LTLAPLSDQDTARLIGSLTGRPVLEAGQQAALLARAGGNPLYAEQYLQMLAERGGGQELPVPDSVQAIIGARLDLLAPAAKHRHCWPPRRNDHCSWPGARRDAPPAQRPKKD
jgi:predicted ATPase